MKVQPISANFKGYQDLSSIILKSERNELINIAEYFHTAPERELHQITRTSKDAYAKLKEAVSGVIVRKKCYIADGAGFCKERAKELDNKAANRNIFLQG